MITDIGDVDRQKEFLQKHEEYKYYGIIMKNDIFYYINSCEVW